MGRRVNLSNLNKDECERILSVIQKDFDIRQKEQERLSKIEEELNESTSQRNVLAKRKEFNEKCCILCCSAFNLLFNKKYQCNDCRFSVCRNCASWESHEKIWLCRVCDQQRTLHQQSCEWFYNHIRKRFKHFGTAKILESLCTKKKEAVDSENDSGYGPASDGRPSRMLLSLLNSRSQEDFRDLPSGSAFQQEDKDLSEVRQHIETVVAGLIGSSLDNARVDRPYSNPQYDDLFSSHHSQLAEVASTLSYALQIALKNKPPDGNVIPTTAHATLKCLILELIELSMRFPEFQEVEELQDLYLSSPQSSVADSSIDVFPSYEDLLASAIINKVVENSQQKFQKQSHVISSDDSKNKNSSHKEKYADVGVQSDINEDITADYSDRHILGSSKTNMFSFSDDAQSPVEYVQVEEIEEVTREEYTDSEEDRNSRLSYLSSEQMSTDDVPHNRRAKIYGEDLLEYSLLSDCDLNANQRVPFPELGVDIVEDIDNSENYEKDSLTCLTSVNSWKDNWLFRKRRLPLYGTLRYQLIGGYDDPPSMLIPNPNDEVQVHIGSRELDDISELSENHSVGSLHFSSESDTDISVNQTNDAITSSLQEKNNNINVGSKISETMSSQIKQTSSLSPRPVPKPRICAPEDCTDLPIPKFKNHTLRSPSTNDPRFTGVPEGTTIHSGKRAHFICEVSGSRPLGVAWYCEDQHLLSEQNYDIYSIRGKHVLDIYNATASDSGKYSCVVYNKNGENWTDFSLKVKATSRATTYPEFVVPLKVIDIVPGEFTRMICTLGGYPDPRLIFFHENKQVFNSHKYVIENKGYGEWIIEIHHLEVEDFGKYTAVAFNEFGKKSSSINLSSDKTINTSTAINLAKITERNQSSKAIKQSVGNLKNGDPVIPANSTAEVQHKDNSQRETFNSPPKPGTIAEREHNKWLNAIHLSNNPYSADNIGKRKGDIPERAPNEFSLSYEEFERQLLEEEKSTNNILVATNICSKVDCGLKSIDPTRYKRDYYINQKRSPRCSKKFSPPEKSTCREFLKDLETEEALNSLEEKVYISAGKVCTLADHVRHLEREVQSITSDSSEDMINLENQVAETFAKVASSDQQITWVEGEVLKVQQALQQSKNKQKCQLQVSGSSEKELPSLPSVRNLAMKFSTSAQVGEESVSSKICTDNLPEEKSLLPDKPINEKSSSKKCSARNNIKVHSLTARSLSKEFRQQALKNVPRTRNSIVSRSQEEKCSTEDTLNQDIEVSRYLSPIPSASLEGSGDFVHGYTSDESTTSTSSLPRMKLKKHVSKSILERASYWERRAEQGLLSDVSVTEDFPSMEQVPDS